MEKGSSEPKWNNSDGIFYVMKFVVEVSGISIQLLDFSAFIWYNTNKKRVEVFAIKEDKMYFEKKGYRIVLVGEDGKEIDRLRSLPSCEDPEIKKILEKDNK